MAQRNKARFQNARPSAIGKNPSVFPGNRRSTRPPTSGMEGGYDGDDYFRQDRNAKGATPTQPDDSITPARITLSVRMRFDAIKGLTFERLVNYLEQWQLGFFRMAGMTWDQMEKRDYQLKVDVPKRRKAVARHGWEVAIIKDVPDADKDLAEAQQEYLEKFYQNITVTEAINPSNVGGMRLLAYLMMDAVGKYYSAFDIVWQPMDDGDLTAKFIHVPVWWLEGTRGKLRFLQSEFQVYGIDMPEGEWLVVCGDGLMEASSIAYLFKNLPIKSWLQLLTRLGGGGLIGKTGAQYGSTEWTNFVEALQDFQEEWAGVFSNNNTDISLLEAKNVTGDGPFAAIIDKMEKAITRMWRGGDMATSGIKDGVGANLQEDESSILENDDPKILEEALDSQVSKFALAWKFGPDAPRYAYFKFGTAPETQDVAGDLAVDAFLLPLGLLEKNSTMERYNRPVPAKGADILKGPAPAPAPGGDPANPSEKTDDDPAPGAEVANAAEEGKFELTSAAQLAAAIRADMQHIADRIAAILQVTDPAVQKTKFAELLKQFPDLTADTLADPSAARVLENIIGTSVAQGLTGKETAHA